MALTREEAKKQRRELMQQIAREHRRKDRERLAELRTRIRSVKGRRKEALRKVVARCRAGRRAAKERAKARALAIRQEARNLIQRARDEEKRKARETCKARKEQVRVAATAVTARRRGELKAERQFQRELRRLEAWTRRRKKAQQRRTAAEARQESDDEVRGNLPPELLPLFETVKRSIKGSSRQSRMEAMLSYAEEHPNEVVDAQEELSRREIARLIWEESALRRAMKSPARSRATREELAAIPF
jgi:hypothetical protein